MKFTTVFLTLFLSVQAFAIPTALTVQELSETAYTKSFSDADTTNTNSILNPSGDVFLVLENPSGSGGSATVTVSAGTSTVEVPGYGPLTKSALAVSLADGETKFVGPFQTRGWNNSSGQLIVAATGAASGSVNLKAFRLKPSLRQ